MPTTSDYLKDLVEQKNALATVISEKGVEASTDEKLNTLVPKVEEVYKAGQMSVISSSEVLKGSASGEVVAVHDVSPVEHKLGVKLTSDTITDFSSVSVSRYGKNLFNKSTVIEGQGLSVSTGGLYGNNTYFTSDYINVKPLTEYTVNWSAYKWACCYDGDFAYLGSTPLSGDKKVMTTLEKAVYLRFTAELAELEVLQLELGSTVTDYEPYVDPQTVTAAADGTVEGLTSIAPNMVLMTDTEGAVIDLEYYKDIDLAFEELTTNIALSGGE